MSSKRILCHDWTSNSATVSVQCESSGPEPITTENSRQEYSVCIDEIEGVSHVWCVAHQTGLSGLVDFWIDGTKKLDSKMLAFPIFFFSIGGTSPAPLLSRNLRPSDGSCTAENPPDGQYKVCDNQTHIADVQERSGLDEEDCTGYTEQHHSFGYGNAASTTGHKFDIQIGFTSPFYNGPTNIDSAMGCFLCLQTFRQI